MAKAGVTQTDFANMCGVNRSVIAIAIRDGKLPKRPDSRIVLSDRKVMNYLQVHTAADAEGKDSEGEENLAVQKLRQEIGKLKDDRELKRLKIEREKEILIEKEKLGRLLFGYIDALNITLLGIPDSMIDYLIAKVKAGGDKGEMIKYIRDSIGREIKSTKAQLKKRFK